LQRAARTRLMVSRSLKPHRFSQGEWQGSKAPDLRDHRSYGHFGAERPFTHGVALDRVSGALPACCAATPEQLPP